MKVIIWYEGDLRKSKVLESAKNGHRTMAMMPIIIGSANDAKFMKFLSTVFNIVDYVCVGVIVFCGATWMLGNRTKAIEHFIGGASGYLIIRNAKNIQEWLKELAG